MSTHAACFIQYIMCDCKAMFVFRWVQMHRLCYCKLIHLVCVCLRVCANASVGVLAHSHCLGGHDCFALLDTHFDSLVIKFCLLSEFRTRLLLQPFYLLLMLSYSVSYPPQRVVRPNQFNKYSCLKCFPVLEELRGHLI